MKKALLALVTFAALCVVASSSSAGAGEPSSDEYTTIQQMAAQFAPYSCASDRNQREALRSFKSKSAPWWFHATNSYIETYHGVFACGFNEQSYSDIMTNLNTAMTDGVRTLLIFAHGGLVPGASGFSGAVAALNGFFPSPGPNPGPSTETLNAYPIFLVWHTGLGESVSGSWFGSNERQSSPHGLYNRKAAFEADVAQRAADGTSHNLDPSDDSWMQLDPAADLNARETFFRMYNVFNVLHIWHFMIDEAEDTVNPKIQDAAGTRLIAKIAELHRQDPGFKVVLVGHSAGAILISALIEQYDRYIAEHPGAEGSNGPMNFDVIFMAPAVSYMRFERALRTGRIANFRMFTMNDTCERHDHVTALDTPVPSASPSPGTVAPSPSPTSLAQRIQADSYPSSLLYFISGVLHIYPDYPLLGLSRYLHTQTGEYEENLLMQDVQTRLMWYKAPIVLAPTFGSPPLGERSNAYRHGYFANDPATLSSVVNFTNHELENEPASPGQSTLPPDTPPPSPAPSGFHGCYDATSSTAL